MSLPDEPQSRTKVTGTAHNLVGRAYLLFAVSHGIVLRRLEYESF